MGMYSRKQRRDALDFAEKLAIIAEAAPNEFARTCTFKAVHLIRTEHGLSDAEKIKDIKYHLEIGCSTYADLNRATGYLRPELVRLVGIMAAARMVDLRSLDDGGRGRPSAFIALIPQAV